MSRAGGKKKWECRGMMCCAFGEGRFVSREAGGCRTPRGLGQRESKAQRRSSGGECFRGCGKAPFPDRASGSARSMPPRLRETFVEGGRPLPLSEKHSQFFRHLTEARSGRRACVWGTGAFWVREHGRQRALRALEKAQFEELADEAVRGSGATAYRHSHCLPAKPRVRQERGACEAAQGRRERPARR